MILDERLEALVTSTELMSGMLKHVLANMEKLSAHVDTISQVVIIHEARLKRLESEGQSPGA